MRKKIGKYTVVKGKLDKEDYREAYILNEKNQPIASCWFWEEALQLAKKWHDEETNGN